jgi:ornithine cyclodeaminase/alanine dehydrogenase-like protein (mu-crystallin family)
VPEASPQAAPLVNGPQDPAAVPQDCLVLSAGEVGEVLAQADLAAARESALLGSPAEEDRRFRQLIAVDSGAFHVVGGAARLAGAELLGLKINGRYDSGRMRGTMLLVDASTGSLTGLMDSSELTVARTAAMVGIAVRHLAPRRPDRALVVGTGRLTTPVIRAVRSSGAFRRIDVWGRRPERAVAVAADHDAAVHAAADLATAARAADVVVTITSATSPVLHAGDLAPGALVVAVGSDAATKQELDPALLADAAVVVDSAAQCLAQGELRSAVAAGLMSPTEVYGELADVVRDGLDPRRSPGQRVVVDLTGIALQDLVAARAICAQARQRGLGRVVRLRP